MWSRVKDSALRFARVLRAGAVYSALRFRQLILNTGAWEAVRDIVRGNRLLSWAAIIALASSLLGYLIAGQGFLDALYSAMALFFVNPVSEDVNALIVLGKYLSLFVAAGVIVNVVSYAFRMVGHYRMNRYEDSTAVYTDNAWGETLIGRLTHGYHGAVRRNGRLEEANHHIFMLKDDLENLNLYATHRDELAGRHAYVMLRDVDAFLLKSEAGDDGRSEDIHFFNLYDLMARTYWREHDLYDIVCKKQGAPVRVAIVGYAEAGRAICRYAVLNNIFRLDQAVEYHVWGCAPHDAAFLSGIQMMNGDSIVTHDGNCMDELKLLSGMDRVILTLRNNIKLLQELLYAAPDVEIHCYNEGQNDLSALYAHPVNAMAAFGDMDALLTEQNIRQETLYRQAKLLNYDYTLRSNGYPPTELPRDYEQQMEGGWRKLNGFLKGSNIARADHLWIERRLAEDGFGDEAPRLEHIRWCRYHFYNRWSYAPKRDNARRKHHLLRADIPDVELSKDEIYSERIRQLLANADAWTDPSPGRG